MKKKKPESKQIKGQWSRIREKMLVKHPEKGIRKHGNDMEALKQYAKGVKRIAKE